VLLRSGEATSLGNVTQRGLHSNHTSTVNMVVNMM